MFIDNVRVEVKAGNGGNGIVSFRREKYEDKGGPNGGDGGTGGSVVFVASERVNTLAKFRYNKLVEARPGKDGSSQNRRGPSADDQLVEVPVGTQFYEDSGELLFDLTQPGQRYVAAEGGMGGFGNAHFKSSTRQAPKVAERGTPGEHKELRLELKLIADAAIIGLPNAGKSTFLSVVSNAKPQIANYAFTTLNPNLGVVDHRGESILLADIPGLIEGAHEGKGLGHDFLRHVERTKAVLHLIDVYGADPLRSYQTIRTELEKYSEVLASLPEVIAFTKCEGLDDDIRKMLLKEFGKLGKDKTIHFISSQAGEGIDPLLDELRQTLEANKQEAVDNAVEAPHVFELTAVEKHDSWHIRKKAKRFIVTGDKIETFAQKTYFDDFHSIQRLEDIMHKLGILKQLDSMGYEAGQVVAFGDPEIGRITL